MPITSFAVGILTFLLGDWRRVAGVVGLMALGVAWVAGDVHGHRAQQAGDAQQAVDVAAMYRQAADAGRRAEEQRQAQIGADITRQFEQQLADRDAAAAHTQAELEKEIAAHKQADGQSDGLVTPTNFDWLQPAAPPAQPGAAAGGN